MKRWSTLILVVAAGSLVACGPTSDDTWFRGDLDAATAAARDADTLVFIEFFTEWCTWCRRLESETLTDGAVKLELGKMVAIRLDAEGRGRSAAERFGIETYPTMVFLDADGEEVERIVGYLPPDKLVGEIQRIRTGDTLVACLEELNQDPASVEAVTRAVEGLLKQSDPEGAVAKIKAFHAVDEHDHTVCEQLMFRAGKDLHYRVYLTAAKLYRTGWKRPLTVPDIPGSKHLSDAMAAGLLDLEPDEQARRMRAARFEDASALLGIVNVDSVPEQSLYEIAEFAFRGGHYETAAELYRRWFEGTGNELSAEDLNRAAWQLYEAQEGLETAIAMARSAYKTAPSADIADTLSHLLYVFGDREEAVQLAHEAASRAPEERAKWYRDVAWRMKRGDDLGDSPAFERYPGPREVSL
jgi:thioredoxin-related protein